MEIIPKKKQPSDTSQDDFVEKGIAFRSKHTLGVRDEMPSDIKRYDLTWTHSLLPFRMCQTVTVDSLGELSVLYSTGLSMDSTD